MVIHARRQMGTRWRHQGRIAGQSLDCWGLILISARLGGLDVPDVAAYGPEPLPDVFLAEVAKRADRVERPCGEFLPGDGLVVAWAHDVPQHLALATGDGWLIHASARDTSRRVTEERIDDSWLRRIHSTWRLHGLEDG